MAAAAASGAVFEHNVANHTAAHRIYTFLYAFDGIAGQQEAAWRKLLQTADFHVNGLVAAGTAPA